MSKDNENICSKCGTVFVPTKKNIILDGKLPLDGTWGLNQMICPKCHPEFVEAKQ